MIDLDSERWRQLRHAYGPAEDIPPLLRNLPSAPVRAKNNAAEPWGPLWSALCHQSDVYTASYAAAPHIILAAENRSAADRAQYLIMVGAIEAMRHKPMSPELPADVVEGYAKAIHAAIPLTLEALATEADPDYFRGLLGALAAFRGFAELAAAVSDLDREQLCPACEHTFATPGYDYFVVE